MLLKNSEDDFNPLAMTIYTLKFQKDNFGKHPLHLGGGKNADQSQLINEYVDIAIDYVKEAVNNIRRGAFPITEFLDSREKVCRFCNYKMICRVDGIKEG